MFSRILITTTLVAGPLVAVGLRHPGPDTPLVCGSCAEWNLPQKPFRIYGNTWYVGPQGLSVLLVTSPEGHILLDGGLAQSAPLIEDNIQALGFKVEDIRWILNTHTHFDHAGGIAALARDTGARVGASQLGVRALRQGYPLDDDPQAGFGKSMRFARVPQAEDIADGGQVKVGDLTLTAHYTPGHTPGGTTWTWVSCEGTRCLNVVFADSLNPISAPHYHFGPGPSSPGIAAEFRRSVQAVADLPCDVMVAVHPGFSRTLEKWADRETGKNPHAFADPEACRNYARDAGEKLEERLAAEKP